MSGPWERFAASQEDGPWSRFATPDRKEEPRAPDRPFLERADDFVRRAANAMTFGMADRVAAGGDAALGYGKYDENLKKEVTQTEGAGERLGTAGRLTADVGGALATGVLLPGMGVTAVGRLPATASLGTRIGVGAAEGAAYGAAQGAGNTYTGNPDDYLRNAGEGALFGGAVGGVVPAAMSAVGRAITPGRAPNQAYRDAVQTLEANGVNLSAGQRTGSPNLAMVESAAERLPMGQWFVRNQANESGADIARAAGRRAGIRGPTPSGITEAELVTARNTIGGEIGAIQRAHPIDANDLRPAMAQVAGVIGDLGPAEQSVVRHLVTGMNRQTLPPDSAQTFRTRINNIMQGKTAREEPVYRNVLMTLRDGLDDALVTATQRAGRPQLGARLNELRQQYANLHVLQEGLLRSGQAGQLGQLTPQALQAAQVSSIGRGNYMQGRGDLTDLAKASAAVLPRRAGSQTAERTATLNPLKWAASLPLNAVVNSRPAQAYLGNQVLPTGLPTQAAVPLTAASIELLQRRRRPVGLLGP